MTATLAFLLLVAACLVAMYRFRVGPRNAREWQYVAIAIAFLLWVLPLMTSVRSR
jgi:hypothetical protein